MEAHFMSARETAKYLGISYSSLMHGSCGTACLAEYRRTAGIRKVVYLREQVEDHAARVTAWGQCGGGCMATAKRLIEEAKARVVHGVAAA